MLINVYECLLYIFVKVNWSECKYHATVLRQPMSQLSAAMMSWVWRWVELDVYKKIQSFFFLFAE